MTGLSFGLLIELSVAVLLALTIGYCIVLNRKLKSLHADREALGRMVNDLVHATTLADAAIKGLKQTAVEADNALSARLEESERFATELAHHVTAGQAVLDRIGRITQAARGSAAVAAEPRKAQSALMALSEHQRQRENAA